MSLLNVPQLSARARTWLTRRRHLPRWGGEPVLQWLSAKTSRATVHAKLSLGFAVAFALVVAVGVFGLVQLNSVNNTSKDLWEGWLPKIEALHRIRSALIEHRVLATRRTQTTNLRHVPDIRQAMTTAQAAVLVEARSYQTWSAHPDERLEFLQFLALWDAYQASFEAVMPRLEVGEFEAARAEFETVTVTVFERAVVRLDSLMAFTKGRINAAAAGADEGVDLAAVRVEGHGVVGDDAGGQRGRDRPRRGGVDVGDQQFCAGLCQQATERAADSADPLRNTRTTKAGLLARAFIAPYYVNYHLEHHLLMTVPLFQLPKFHRLLSERGLTRPPAMHWLTTLCCKNP